MNRRIAVVAALCVLALSCDPLDRDEITLTFDDTGENVRIKVLSDQGHIERYHANDGAALGEDVLAGRDEWTARFNAANAGEERISIARAGRKIKSVEDEAVVKTAELQRFFFDAGVTVQVMRGEGWTELLMIPGASNRATNRQREMVRRRLDDFSHLAATYFEAVRNEYKYLDANPARAEEMLFALYADKPEDAQLSDEERALAGVLRRAAEALADAGERDQKELDRNADLAFNPFPGAVSVRVPSEPLIVEGFERDKDGALIAGTDSPLEAIVKLEGRWVSPDPIAQLLHAEGLGARDLAIKVASQPRKAAPVVVAAEIQSAIEEGIRPAPRFRVRWATKPKSSGS